MSKTRIVATYGPACADPAVLAEVISAGVDVMRVNCSHGSAADRVAAVAAIRAAAESVGRRVAVLADLQGPKIRVGELSTPMHLIEGAQVRLEAGIREAADGVIPVVYPAFADDLKPRDRVLLHDGLLELVVDGIHGSCVDATVTRGGMLLSRKGINMPGASVSAEALTAKDLSDLPAMLEAGVDYIALSFVRSGADGMRLRRHLRGIGGDTRIVAKLEHPEALEHLDNILDVFDAVMVARGDLGVEVGPELVPLVQKRIIAAANAAGVPVITATEMLESMITAPRPTRAEASDIANAVFDGTDAVMLSGETASGAHPVEAVTYMRRICETAETQPEFYRCRTELGDASTPDRAVAHAVTRAAADLSAAAVIVFSETGRSAQLVAENRPPAPILALSRHDSALARTCLYRGVRSAHIGECISLPRQLVVANSAVQDAGLAKPGDIVIIVGGIPQVAGATNRMYVHTVTE